MSDKKQQEEQRRVEAPQSSSNRAQANQTLRADNSNVFKQLFATLEAEHQKLHALEQRRLRLTEEMKSLREKLREENRRLRSSSEEADSRAVGSSSTAKKSNLKKPTR